MTPNDSYADTLARAATAGVPRRDLLDAADDIADAGPSNFLGGPCRFQLARVLKRP